MEKIDELLERRQNLSQEKDGAQSSWLIEMIDDLIFNIDLQLQQLNQLND